MPLADGATFAGYTILRQLGSGGMGEVYLAQHPRLPRRDALKVLPATVSSDTEYRERFHREADIAATLWHPHIVGVHDRGNFEGQLWISMDYVEGTDAAHLLRDRYPNGMPREEVVEIVAAVADALDYAHQRKLLHRDVKPANILLAHPGSPEQRILLADFGIARWADDVSGLTATNMTVGTVSYAAPEQLMGGQLDGRADQYALAASAFHLLTGSPPFQHSNPAVVISQHLSGTPPAIGQRRPELAALDPVFAKALAKDPNDRFERCAGFAHALGHHPGIAGSTEDTTPATSAAAAGAAGAAGAAKHTAAHASSRRSAMRAGVVIPAVLAVVLIAAVAVTVGVFLGKDESRAPPPAAQSSSPVTSPTLRPLPPPPEPPPSPTTTSATAAPPAAPVAVIGADCSPVGSSGTTAGGATAYCSTLQTTGASIWSLNPGDIPSPTVTPDPTEEPLPLFEESPVRVCMEQTGQTRRQCREDIRRSNGLPPLP
jgi:serine/threonine-protein kinase